MLFRKDKASSQPLPPIETCEGDRHPITHCQEEIERDLEGHTLISDELMLKWFRDAYSSSKHLLTLYSMAIGIQARTLVEIGFGRSSFVLARAAAENGGHFIACDRRDFSYLLSAEEKAVTTFVLGYSHDVWNDPSVQKSGIDFAFLDYFSAPELSADFVVDEIRKCSALMPGNGLLCIHDAAVEKYAVSQLNWSKVDRSLEAMALPYNYGLWVVRKRSSTVFPSLSAPWTKKEDTSS